MFNERFNKTFKPEKEETEAQREWKAIRKEVDRLVDKLNKPVDEGIKEAVTGFRFIGLRTTMSCEGHPGEHIRAPYIDFETSISTELRARYEAAKAKGDHEERHRADREAAMLIAKDWNKLLPLLDEFYRDRQVPSDQRLMLEVSGSHTRFESQGARVLRGQPEKLAHEQLEAYRSEMSAFSDFVRSRLLRS